MGSDRLEELLTETDAALPPPRSGAALCERVAARAARRRHLRAGLMATALIALGMAATYLMRPWSPVTASPHSTPPAFNSVAFHNEMAALDAEASIHQRIAGEFAAFQREADALKHARLRAVLAEGLPSHFQEARERAARILLMDADRLVATRTARAQALDDYRRAIELFPDTPAAQEAQRRLKAAGA